MTARHTWRELWVSDGPKGTRTHVHECRRCRLRRRTNSARRTVVYYLERHRAQPRFRLAPPVPPCPGWEYQAPFAPSSLIDRWKAQGNHVGTPR